MTSDLLRRIGEGLYGARWQTDLAAALGVSDRTVRRWLSGEDQPRPGVWRDLALLVAERRGDLAALARELDRSLPPPS